MPKALQLAFLCVGLAGFLAGKADLDVAVQKALTRQQVKVAKIQADALVSAMAAAKVNPIG